MIGSVSLPALVEPLKADRAGEERERLWRRGLQEAEAETREICFALQRRVAELGADKRGVEQRFTDLEAGQQQLVEAFRALHQRIRQDFEALAAQPPPARAVPAPSIA